MLLACHTETSIIIMATGGFNVCKVVPIIMANMKDIIEKLSFLQKSLPHAVLVVGCGMLQKKLDKDNRN